MYKYRILWIIVFTVGGVLSVVLTSRSPLHSPHETELKKVMHELYATAIELRPFISSQRKFADPAARPQISENLQKLVVLAEHLEIDQQINQVSTLESNASMFRAHLEELNDIFNEGKVESARWAVNASFSFCISCHTQIPQKVKPSIDWRKDLLVKQRETPFEFAEFNFVTRRFKSAVKIYDDLIRNYPNSDTRLFDLETAMLRKLTFYTRVQPDPKAGAESFKKDLENENLPLDFRNNVKLWIAEFEEWQEEDVSLEDMEPLQLLTYIDKNIRDKVSDRSISSDSPHLVSYLRLSGALYKQVHSGKREDWMPHFLYFLGKIEKQLGYRYTFSLSTRYFQKCVQEYPEVIVSQDCMREYENYLSADFNDRLPKSKEIELEQLRRQLIDMH